MKILYIGNYGQQNNEDMLADSLLYGLTRCFGMANVDDYFHYTMYRRDPECLQNWPVRLGVFNYTVPHMLHTPRGLQDIERYDVQFVTFRFFQVAVRNGVVTQLEFDRICGQLRSEKLIMINPLDDCPGWHLEHEFLYLDGPPRLLVSRPPHRWMLNEMTVHISCPMEYLQFQLGQAEAIKDRISVYAALSDNHDDRRSVMSALGKQKFKGSLLRWGSEHAYRIRGVKGTVPIPRYLREMQAAQCVVSCRGNSIDTLRTWEAFALGKCLITQWFGFDEFQDGVHCLYYQSPAECLSQVAWALSHKSQAKEIGQNARDLYLMSHTPEAQAWRIMQRAGFVEGSK